MAGDPNYASVSLLLHGDGANGSTTFADSGPAPKVVTPNSCTISTAQSKYGGSSMAFNGTTSRLSLAGSADFDFGTGDFTVEVWARFTGHTTIQTLVGNYLDSTTGWALQVRSDTGTIRFGHGDAALLDVSWTPTDGVWYHLAVSRSGSSLRAFVDGTQVGSTVANTTSIAGSSNPLLVGGLFLGVFMQPFNGHLDDVRITKGVARYVSAFTPPARPYPSGLGEVEGVVLDEAGAPCARTVRLIRRDTGALLDSTVSDAATGAYRLATPTLDEVCRIVHDDSAGTLYNDLIDRVIPA